MSLANMFEKVFPKKEEVHIESVPVNEVSELKKRGYSNEQIINTLKGMGFTLTQIKDALTQADIKAGVQDSSLPKMPAEQEKFPEINLPEMPILLPPDIRPSSIPAPPPTKKEKEEVSAGKLDVFKREDVETLVESIVEEKWEDFKALIEEINEWKEELKQKMEFISQRLDKMEMEVGEVAKKSLKKDESYNKTVEDVNVHMEAFQRAMQDVIPSLAASIRELKDVSKTLKK